MLEYFSPSPTGVRRNPRNGDPVVLYQGKVWALFPSDCCNITPTGSYIRQIEIVGTGLFMLGSDGRCYDASPAGNCVLMIATGIVDMRRDRFHLDTLHLYKDDGTCDSWYKKHQTCGAHPCTDPITQDTGVTVDVGGTVTYHEKQKTYYLGSSISQRWKRWCRRWEYRSLY